MRSRRSRPVSLSSSYLTLEPIGISMTAVNSAGKCSPGVTSCQACVITQDLSTGRATGGNRPRRRYQERLVILRLQAADVNEARFTRDAEGPVHVRATPRAGRV